MLRCLLRRIGQAFAALLAVWLVLRLWPCPAELLDPPRRSIRFLARDDSLLRDVPVLDAHQAPVPLSRVSPWLVAAVRLSEDRRFALHPGVDPIAIGRAARDDLAAGRIVSGGSTITQQYVRNCVPIPRTFPGKAREAFLALVLERRLGKDAILERYLNVLPFGHNLRGVQQASLAFFGKDVSRLGPAEAAVLAVVPRGPSLFDPSRNMDRILGRSHRILRALYDEGLLDERALDAALAWHPVARRPEHPFEAPHATVRLLAGLDVAAGGGDVHTTIDREVQQMAESALATHLAEVGRRDVGNGAVLVADNATGEVLALVGSRDFFDAASAGQVDGTGSPRQPGSTLKPFLYAMAIERGDSPATLLHDVPTPFSSNGATWSPRDHDRRFRGPVRLREALAASLNVPAARLLATIGVERFQAVLRDLGFDELDAPSNEYGIGLVLGDGPVRLASLVEAYSALARLGTHVPLTLVQGRDQGLGQGLRQELGLGLGRNFARRHDAGRVFSARTAWLIADILSDRWARAMTFGSGGMLRLPFRAAVKTGTSTDHRDSWCVGYTPEYTVGVWVGNMSGERMDDVWGSSGAAPVFRSVMTGLARRTPPTWYAEPRDVVHRRVCPLSGATPGPDCPGAIDEVFPAGTTPGAPCKNHVRVRIDRRNGLLAGPDCDPDRVVEQVLISPEPEDRATVIAAGTAVVPDASSPHCPAAAPPASDAMVDVQGRGPLANPVGDNQGRVRIASPLDGEVYRIDPDVPPPARTLALVATGIPPGRTVRWRIDGRPGPVCRTGEPCRWPLVPGRHEIRLEGTSAPPVVIDVRL